MTIATSSPVLGARNGSPPNELIFDVKVDRRDAPKLHRRYRLGLALYISSLVMLFVGFSSAYIVRRGIPTYEAATGTSSISWEPLQLPITLLLFNTLLLAGASLAIEKLRRSNKTISSVRGVEIRAQRAWIFLTLLLSLGFILGQAIAWQSLRMDGHLMNSGARSAFFYVLTGTHGLHAIVGIAALAWIAIRYSRWLPARRLMAVDLTAWYLHSMTVLWVYLFVFLTIA